MPKHPLSRFTRFRPTVSAMVRTAVWAAGVIFRSQPPTPTDADRCKPLMADANQMIAESCGNLMGPSWPKRYAGGDSAVLRHRLARKQGLQGLRFAPGSVGKRAESPVSAGLCGMAATRKVRTLMRTWFAGLHPGQTKNGQDRKLNAGEGLQAIRWLGCRNRPTSLCAPSDASDTGCRNFP